MTASRILRTILTYALVFAHVGAGAQVAPAVPASERKFHFVVPTKHDSHHADRASSFKLEIREASFDRMAQLLRTCDRAGILPDFRKKPTKLHVYLESAADYQEQRDALAFEAHRQFEEVYPDGRLELEFHVIKTSIKAAYLYEKQKTMLEKMKVETSGDPQAQAALGELERANEEAFRETNARFSSAGGARRVKLAFALSRAFVVGATRFAQTAPQMMMGGVPMVASLAFVGVDAVTEFYLVARSQKMQRFFARWPKVNTRYPTLNTIVASAIHMTWNMALFSIARPIIMQLIQHIADPMTVPQPTLESIGTAVLGILVWSIPAALIFTFFAKGYNKARDKEWISGSQIDVGLQVPGVGDSLNAIVSSNPDWYWLRPWINYPQWAFYIVAGALGFGLKRRADRLVAVDASITSWEDDIHPEQLTDASYWVETNDDFKRALGVISGQGVNILECGDLFLKAEPPPPEAKVLEGEPAA